MATVNLGRIKPVFRGAYDNSTAYVIDDIVTSGNETFIAIAATQGNATSDASKWTKLAAKGADGTDVAATLANKEIAFKTNAGALDGIPIGTAGQFLKVNSGATGYEYGTVTVPTSDYVKIASGTFSGSASVDFASSLFDGSTYHSFVNMIEVENNSGTQAGNGEFYPLSNGSYSSAVSSNGIRMNSSSTNVNGLQRDNSNSCIFMTDGFRNMRALLKIESNGMNRAVNKNHIIHYNRPNQDATHRAIFEFHQVFHGNVASSGSGYRLTFPATCQGAYKLYGRKG